MNWIKSNLKFDEQKQIMLLLAAGDFFITLSTFISIPYISLYLLKTTSYRSDAIGWVIGLSSLIGILSAFVGGHLSDKLGRSKLIYFSLFGSVLVYLMYYLSATFLIKIHLLVAFTLLGGIAATFTSIYHPVSQAFITDYFPYEKKASCFQIIYIAANIGCIVAPLFALLLGVAAKKSGFLVSALIYLIYALLIIRYSKKIRFFQSQTLLKKYPLSSSLKLIINDSRLRAFILSGFALSMCCSQFDVTLSQYMNSFLHNAVKVYSMVMVVNSLVVVIVQTIIFNGAKRFNASRLISIGCLIAAMGFFIISFSHFAIGILFLGVIILSMGEVFIYPNYGRFLDQIAPEHLKGSYFGVSFLRLFGTFIGPIVGGYCLRYYNGEILFMLTSIVAVVACLLQLSALRQSNLKRPSYDAIS